jgi:glyoxylase-like metal-dependent hydrolase (beta-lactamase superfamily II)
MEFDVVPIITLGGNAYILKGKHVALVDTLHPKAFKKIVRALSEEGLSVGDIELVLITHNHFDHVGNVARIKEISGATVIAGAADAGVIEGTEMVKLVATHNRLGKAMSKLPESWVHSSQKFDKTTIDRQVEGGDRIDELGLEVLGLPGHTTGGVGFLDRERNRAFIGDMVSNYFSRAGMPALVGSDDVDDIYRSQELLAGLDLDVAYPGHGKIIEPDASKIIGLFVDKKKAATP